MKIFMKKATSIFCFILIIFSLTGCSKTKYQPFSTETNFGLTDQETPDIASNPLLGVWNADTNVGHLIENTYGYENVDFYVTIELCFKADNTFTFKIINVNEDELINIFTENGSQYPQERMEATRNALYIQTDSSHYDIQGNTLIIDGKYENNMEISMEIKSSTSITLRRDGTVIDMTLVGTP